jgi:hypothetical protein
MKSVRRTASRFIYSGYARLAIIVIPLLGIVALLMPPVITDTNEMGKEHRAQFQQQIDPLNDKVQKLGISSENDFLTISLNPLLNIVDDVTLGKGKSIEDEYHYAIRWDLIMVVVGIIFTVYMMQTYFARFNQVDEEALVGNLHQPLSNEDTEAIISDTTYPGVALSNGAETASKRAVEVFARSTIMLFSGILFAIIGVFTFAFTISPGYESEDRINIARFEELRFLQDRIYRLTEDSKNSLTPTSEMKDALSELQNLTTAMNRPTNVTIGSLLTRFLMNNSRALGMLFFIETISWFLLRQYRSLVEDYKWFYRLYIKRQNYLVAFLIARNIKGPKDPTSLVSKALIEEDLSGRIAVGMTTEELENLKLVDQNPVMAMTQLLAGQLGYVMTPSAENKYNILHKFRTKSDRDVSNASS